MASILGTGKDNNEELEWRVEQTQGEGYLHYTAGAQLKRGLFRAAASLGKYWGHAGLKDQSSSAEESEVQIH